jgi:hypothetical protein
MSRAGPDTARPNFATRTREVPRAGQARPALLINKEISLATVGYLPLVPPRRTTGLFESWCIPCEAVAAVMETDPKRQAL